MKNINLAGCVIQNPADKILLLHRDNGKRNHWETPGGKVDSGETPQLTAIRELKEELDVVVKLTHKIGEAEFTEDDRHFHYTWYKAEIVKGIPAIQEPHTFTKFKYFSWKEMEDISSQLSPNTQNLLKAYQHNQLNWE